MPAQSESQRLRSFYEFDEDVLAVVEDVANHQRRMDFGALDSILPDNQTFYPSSGIAAEIMDTGQKGATDRTLIYHLPMGVGLDENQRARLATLSASLPTTRIVAAGNPGPPGQRSGVLSWREIPSVFRGDLRATVEPILQYTRSQGLTLVTHAGCSFAADKAPTAAIHSSKYDQLVEQVISIEPTSVENRKFLDLEALGVIDLGLDFRSTREAQASYVEATNSSAFFEARRLSDIRARGMTGYELGLFRLSNIASANALAKAYFEDRMTQALEANPEMRSDTTWGTASELAINGLVVAIIQRLVNRFGADRVSGTPMEGLKHAACDDIFLHAATVLQSLKKSKRA